MKFGLLFTSFGVFTPLLFSQGTPLVKTCEVKQVWSCNPDKSKKCGTLTNPAVMRLDPVNCPDSMYDAHCIYNLVPMGIPGDSTIKIRKIPADRYNYFIRNGKPSDSFVLNLDGCLMQFLWIDTSYYYQIKILKEGLHPNFHVDIHIQDLSMSISKPATGELLIMHRKYKYRGK